MSGIIVYDATLEDYIKVQGGKPTVTTESGLTVVTHGYSPDPIIVRSHLRIEEYGTVTLNVEGNYVLFPTALLRIFHGDPCEKKSLLEGGQGYERIKRQP